MLFSVQSSAPLSTTETLAFLTSRFLQGFQDNSLDLSAILLDDTAFNIEFDAIRTGFNGDLGIGRTQRVPAMAAFFNSMKIPPSFLEKNCLQSYTLIVAQEKLEN